MAQRGILFEPLPETVSILATIPMDA